MIKKAIVTAIACVAAFAAQATTLRGDIVIGKGDKASVIHEVCNATTEPMIYEFKVAQYKNGDLSEGISYPKGHIRLSSNVIGDEDEPVKPGECNSIEISNTKNIKVGELYVLETRQVSVSGGINKNGNDVVLHLGRTAVTVIFPGNDIFDKAVLSGVVKDDGIHIENTGKRGVSITGIYINDVWYEIFVRQIFGDNKGVLKLRPLAEKAVKEAVEKKHKIFAFTHLGQKIEIKQP